MNDDLHYLFRGCILTRCSYAVFVHRHLVIHEDERSRQTTLRLLDQNHSSAPFLTEEVRAGECNGEGK